MVLRVRVGPRGQGFLHALRIGSTGGLQKFFVRACGLSHFMSPLSSPPPHDPGPGKAAISKPRSPPSTSRIQQFWLASKFFHSIVSCPRGVVWLGARKEGF